MTFQEETERTLWSIPFTATVRKARELYVALQSTDEWVRWSTISDQITHGDFSADDIKELCKRHTNAYRAMSRMVVLKLTELEIDQ